jgi:hypothetical protein
MSPQTDRLYACRRIQLLTHRTHKQLSRVYVAWWENGHLRYNRTKCQTGWRTAVFGSRHLRRRAYVFSRFYSIHPDFPHPFRPTLGPTQPPIKWVPNLSPVVKRPERGVKHPPSSSAEVKDRAELYLYSPSGPSWPVLGRTFQFTQHIQANSNRVNPVRQRSLRSASLTAHSVSVPPRDATYKRHR